MSLAEELLADLEDDDEVEDVPEAAEDADEQMDHDGQEVEDEKMVMDPNAKGSNVKEVAKLFGSKKLNSIMKRIEEFSQAKRTKKVSTQLLMNRSVQP